MNPQARTLMALAMVVLMVAPVAAFAMPSGAGQYRGLSSNAWVTKFHPALLSKVLSGEISDNDVVTVVFRLEPLPSYTASLVKGDYERAVNALKTWASITQAGFIAEVYKRGGEVVNKFWIDNVVLVKAKMGVIKELAAYPSVVSVFENFKVHVLEPVEENSVDVRPGQQVESWGIFKIDAPGAWAQGYLGDGVRIATLDTGVDVTHPALEGKMLTLDPNSPYYPGGWMEFDENGNPVLSQPHDTHGHGTHVSGTALGGDTENILIGVAPHATLMHGLVLPGGSGTFAQVLAGIQWAVEPFYIDPDSGQIVYTGLPAHVISMSLGASGYYGDDLFPGIEAALLANIIVVAAIGNDGQGISSNPGNIWGVFGIGATDQDDQVAYFSSGEVVNWPSPPAEWPFYDTYPSQYIKPDFSAPGVSITSSVPGGGYEAWSGTSMATPHVAGVVALVLQASGWYENPVEDTPERVYEILKNTSLDLGDPGQDTEYGWGRVNASAAVQLALQYALNSGVQGYVLDSIDSSPVKWAKIHVVEANKTYGVLPDGFFKIPLEPGTYHLEVTAWGYYNKTIVVNVTIENGTIAGIVYDAFTQAPIAGAAVSVVEANITVYTNESGFFQATVPAGSYTLTVSASGYQPYETSVSVGENETVILNIPLVPAGYGTIEGYVTDADTGEPIQGALVVVDENYNLSAVTDASGYYSIPSVPAGFHTVYAYANGYQPGVMNVTVQPNETVMVNFSLVKIPPAIAVIGNDNGGVYHLINSSFGAVFYVANYSTIDAFLEDWFNGVISPVVIVIDHWYADHSTPPEEIVLATLIAANATGVPIVFLDTSYSGATGGKGLYYYQDNVTALGFTAPTDYYYDYPSPEYVHVVMLNQSHPIFNGVEPDGDNWFYLANLTQSSYADYLYWINFTLPVETIGLINDTSANTGGIGVALWMSSGGSLWVFLSSWAESYWMKYLQPGSDGMYSENTAKVLVNAVAYALAYAPLGEPVKPGFAKAISMASSSGTVKIQKYTNITIYLDRLPFGFVEGIVKGSDGLLLSNATIVVKGTPVEATTSIDGYFKIWLPEGNYTLCIKKPGYAKTLVNVTVVVNSTVDLGVIELKRVPRIAILYDFNGELRSLIQDRLGWYAEDFNDPIDFAEALNDTFFDAGIWAGYYLAPFPSYDELKAVMDAINATGKSVIFMDQWSSPWYPQFFGYGIRTLHEYTGDPAQRFVDDYYGEIYIKIEQSSPLFRGYSVGEMVKILNYNTGGYGTDWAAFKGFSGDVLATLYLGGSEYAGDAIGLKALPNGAKLVLMASWAPEEYQDIQWWTEDMINIFLNAVKWIAAKPVNVTPSTVEAYVGDTINFTISGAPANYTFAITLDSVPVGNVTTDVNGTATFTLKVPVVPGGSHVLYLEGMDESYYGQAIIVVKAKLVLSPAESTVPASIAFNATGLPASAIIHIYIDSNYLGSAASDDKGLATGIVNIPFVSTGTHCVRILDSNLSLLAKAKFNATNSLDQIVMNLSDLLSGFNASIAKIVADETGKVYALVNDTSKQILVQLGDVKNLVETKYSDLESLLEQVNGSLAGLIQTKSGEIYALINTSSGQILAKLTGLEDTIKQKSDEIIKDLQDIQQSILDLQNSVNASLSQVSQTADTAKSKANQSLAVGSIALIASLASLATIFRRP